MRNAPIRHFEKIGRAIMNEQEFINTAYAETVETLFKVFFGEFTSAHGDPDAEQGAKDRFSKGINHARHVRELALALVPE
jgi:hypothetical protein